MLPRDAFVAFAEALRRRLPQIRVVVHAAEGHLPITASDERRLVTLGEAVNGRAAQLARQTVAAIQTLRAALSLVDSTPESTDGRLARDATLRAAMASVLLLLNQIDRDDY